MVYLYVADGFEEIEALAVVDILRRGEVEVKLVSLSGRLLVTSAHDIRVEADCLFEDIQAQDAEMMILPGGLPGTEKMKRHTGLLAALREQVKQNRPVAAICAAPTVLGQEGLLIGRTATSYPGTQEQLTGAHYSTDIVAEDGNLITSQGPGTAIPFGLAVLRKLRGTEAEQDVGKRMLVY